MPPIGSDLLLLTWHVTRLFSARCLVPHRPLCYRPGLCDLAHPAIPRNSFPWEPSAHTTTTDGRTQ
ncbi:unnamed protein product [Staurois parvus]|uniref:Secreted protein n=1 Tax=Staurois parvus TaxID=386267 RepID=A0ABN9ADZ0_9NEOB|nr:unnamed protein product [Staurois parvus]